METTVFIGACFMIAEVGPSADETALIVLICVMYMKTLWSSDKA